MKHKRKSGTPVRTNLSVSKSALQKLKEARKKQRARIKRDQAYIESLPWRGPPAKSPDSPIGFAIHFGTVDLFHFYNLSDLRREVRRLKRATMAAGFPPSRCFPWDVSRWDVSRVALISLGTLPKDPMVCNYAGVRHE